jgi:PAS domain S-box-containing protein
MARRQLMHLEKAVLLQKKTIEVIRILLIEDNPSYAKLIGLMLEEVDSNRFDLIGAKRLIDGLQHIQEGKVDVILLNLNLPDSQGIETFDSVYSAAKNVPIIVLTEIDNKELAFEAVGKGALEYLIKEELKRSLLAYAIRNAIELKRLEDALKVSEERFRGFIDEILFEGIIIHDDNKIIEVNQQVVTMLGYARDELIGMNPLEVIAPEYHEIVSQYTGNKYKKPYETVAVKKDGNIFPVEIRAHYIPFHGKMVRAVVVRDITERRHAEEELREKALIFENIYDAIIVIDLEGKILNWNPAAEKMFGFRREEILRKTIGMVTTKIIKGSLHDGRWIGEINFIRKDGTDGVCEITVIPMLDKDGNATSVFGVCRDITERKQSEKKLVEGYDQLRETLIATVNTLASTIEMRDPYTAGHQRRVTILACAIAEEIGLSEDQFDGLRMAGLIHDLGKINVPAEILSKPGRINDIEFGIIQYHPQICYDILKSIELPWPVAKIILHHHERIDGSGYPQGLKGDEIMLEAKILAVADVVEAMASHRPYRPALGIDVALNEIKKNKGTLYDPSIVDACVRLFSEKKFKFE